MDVPALDVTAVESHAVCPCASGFSTECCVSKVHPHCGECQRLPHFRGRVKSPVWTNMFIRRSLMGAWAVPPFRPLWPVLL